jgi:hypothetical protein
MSFIKPAKLAALVFIALTGIVLPTHSQVVVYNSFGPGYAYNTGHWVVGGASSPHGYQGHAEYFTPGISGYLSSVQLATYRQASGSGLSNFYIAQDNGSGTPGIILESFASVLNVTGLLTLNSTVKPLLQAGTEYWLCDEPTASDSYNGWYQNNQGVTNGFAAESSEWGWYPAPAPVPINGVSITDGVFRVSVTPVPEPSVVESGIMCGCCLLLFRWRKCNREKRLKRVV